MSASEGRGARVSLGTGLRCTRRCALVMGDRFGLLTSALYLELVFWCVRKGDRPRNRRFRDSSMEDRGGRTDDINLTRLVELNKIE